MKIRTQLFVSGLLALALTLLAGGFIWEAERNTRLSDQDLQRTQFVAQQVANLLVLTQEFSNNFEQRAEQQWHRRHAMLQEALVKSFNDQDMSQDAQELVRHQLKQLPCLFSRLSELADQSRDSFNDRRKQFLVDQLLTKTQVMADIASRWTTVSLQKQRIAARRHQVTQVAALLSFLMMMLAQTWWLSRRVLVPLEELKRASTAIEQGRLDSRIDDGANNELGSLARRFNAMVAALDERTQQLHDEIAMRLQSERRIRAVTDHMPALISYVDKEGRYQFANAYYQTIYGVDPSTFIGKSVAECLGSDAYKALKPYLETAFGGEHVKFERSIVEQGQDVHFLVDYQPDLNDDGNVNGIYVMVLDITARKKAELSQAESEERTRAILTHAPDAFIGMDDSGRIVEWNRQAERTFGWKQEEVLGRSVAEVIIPPEMRQAHENGLERFKSSGTGPVIDNRIEVHALHRLGHLIPVQMSIAAIRQDGRYAANAFLHDISERKEAAGKLAAIQRRLQDVMNNIPALIGYFDMNERCRFANHAALQLYGLESNQANGLQLAQILGSENYEQHRLHVAKVLSGERSTLNGSLELNGKTASFQAHFIPEWSEDGSIQGFYIMTFDISKLKDAERERAKVDQRLRTITDNLPVLISYIDQDRRLQFCNGTFKHWLGVNPDEAVGSHVRDIIGEGLYEQRKDQMDQALSGENVRFEVNSEAGGANRYLQTVYIPDQREDGTVAGIYTMSTDVTELKKVEQQLSVLARFDALTGLPNRRQFEEKLQEALDRSERQQQHVALLFLDVDKFKAINDTFGHGIGDEVLREFALRLTKCVRKTDTVARLAGDEFVVLLEGLHTMEEPQFVARKIIATIGFTFEISGRSLAVSTSIGIAASDAKSISPARLLAMADEALYQAKGAGRNTFRAINAS